MALYIVDTTKVNECKPDDENDYRVVPIETTDPDVFSMVRIFLIHNNRYGLIKICMTLNLKKKN